MVSMYLQHYSDPGNNFKGLSREGLERVLAVMTVCLISKDGNGPSVLQQSTSSRG